MTTATLDYCPKCGAPHKPERCQDCHAWGRPYGMGRSGWAYRWNHEPGCSRYKPSHYPYAEQDRHTKAFGGKPLSDGTCPTTGIPALECDHCLEAADRDDYGLGEDFR